MNKIFIVVLLAVLTVGMASCCRPCRRAKPADVKGVRWELIELQDRVIDRSDRNALRLTYTLTLGEDGRLGGRGGCNTFFAGYTLNGNRIEVASIGATRMLCPDQELENLYFRTLERAVGISIDGDFLILSDSSGEIIASFRRAVEQE